MDGMIGDVEKIVVAFAMDKDKAAVHMTWRSGTGTRTFGNSLVVVPEELLAFAQKIVARYARLRGEAPAPR